MAANVPVRHESHIRDDAGAPHPWRKTRDYVDGRAGSGFLIGLLGNRGTGKTQIAVQAIVHACAVGRPALYVKAMDVFFWVRQARLPNATRSDLDLLSDFMCPRLLVIDELGERGETEFEDRTLTYIIDKRYDAMHDTLLIANMTEKAFRESMGPSISDRLRECGGVIECKWPSFRGTQ